MLFQVYSLLLAVSLICTSNAAPQASRKDQVNNATSGNTTSESNNNGTSNYNIIFEDIIESGLSKVRPFVNDPKILSIWADTAWKQSAPESSLFIRVTMLIDDPEKSEEIFLDNDPEDPIHWPGGIKRRPYPPKLSRVKPWSYDSLSMTLNTAFSLAKLKVHLEPSPMYAQVVVQSDGMQHFGQEYPPEITYGLVGFSKPGSLGIVYVGSRSGQVKNDQPNAVADEQAVVLNTTQTS